MMAAKPEELGSASALEDFYQKTAEFPAGFMTEYPAGLLVGEAVHQGVYAAVGGPNFESVAEVKMLRLMGADLVGILYQPWQSHQGVQLFIVEA